MGLPTRRGPLARRALLGALAVVVLAVVAGIAVLALGDDEPEASGAGRALGSTMAACLEFSLDALAQQPLAFDGTVTSIDGAAITFSIERWYRGGSGDTAVARAAELVDGAVQLEGGVGFVEGQRYLVSGDRQDGALVPAICGFTMEWTADAGDDWARAFGA